VLLKVNSCWIDESVMSTAFAEVSLKLPSSF
jgi:hypothetical protein